MEIECSTSSGQSSQHVDASSSGINKMVILDGKFFKLIKEKCTCIQTIAACGKCEPAHIEIKGYTNFSSNFRYHLKRKHGQEAIDEYKNYVKKQKSEKNMSEQQCARNKTISKDNFEMNIVKFVVHSMILFSIVDDPFFNKIFVDLNIPSKGLKMLSRCFLCRKMEALFISSVQRLKDTLKHVKYVCTTTDIWSGRRRSFFSITVHWIKENMGRQSAALACKRSCSSHTAERIAE